MYEKDRSFVEQGSLPGGSLLVDHGLPGAALVTIEAVEAPTFVSDATLSVGTESVDGVIQQGVSAAGNDGCGEEQYGKKESSKFNQC